MINYNVDINRLARTYLLAKRYVINSGFSEEIDWQENVNFKSINQQTFMKEYCWVVLASGLSDKVVSKVFPKIQSIFKNWESLDFIVENSYCLFPEVLKVFNNKLKISAIFQTINYIRTIGFDSVKRKIKTLGLDYLKTFPFIGEATCFHFAKNIGLPYAKPDRHLLKISKNIGYKTPHELCAVISDLVAEKIQVVDLVIWRYATLDKNYEYKLQRLFFIN